VFHIQTGFATTEFDMPNWQGNLRVIFESAQEIPAIAVKDLNLIT
jgi:hypothetical protein